jgi:hypothetical protein
MAEAVPSLRALVVESITPAAPVAPAASRAASGAVAMSVAAVVREASARADRPSPEAEGSKEPAAAAPRAASWTGTKEALAATAAVEAAVAAAAAAAVGSAAADAAWTTASHDGGGPAAEGSAAAAARIIPASANFDPSAARRASPSAGEVAEAAEAATEGRSDRPWR